MNMYEARRIALADLVRQLGRGGIAAVAREIEKSWSYVSRMLYPPGKPQKKRIGEESWALLIGKFPQLVESAPALRPVPPLHIADGTKTSSQSATAWLAYIKASPATTAAIDLLLLPPQERKALMKKDKLVHHCIVTLEQHALEVLKALKSA